MARPVAQPPRAARAHPPNPPGAGVPPRRTASLRRSAKPALCALPPWSCRHASYRFSVLVMANIADKMLNNRKPTPTAMTMIMAGSIKLVMTRNCRLSSFS